MSRKDFVLPMRTFINIYMRFKINPYISGKSVPGVEHGRATSVGTYASVDITVFTFVEKVEYSLKW